MAEFIHVRELETCPLCGQAKDKGELTCARDARAMRAYIAMHKPAGGLPPFVAGVLVDAEIAAKAALS